MGKNSLFCYTNLRQFCRFTSEVRQLSSSKPSSSSSSIVSSYRQREMNKRKMDNDEERRRFPLSMVVTDCVKRWFRDTLKEAREGDIAMQVLVGQMYLSGYGVSQNAQKTKPEISRPDGLQETTAPLDSQRLADHAARHMFQPFDGSHVLNLADKSGLNGKAWIRRAAKSRSSVWKVSNKRPGYNASDSDSDETKSDIK